MGLAVPMRVVYDVPENTRFDGEVEMLNKIVINGVSQGGEKFDVPPDFARGIQRANGILETELLPSLNVEMTATWKFLKHADGRIQVMLDLTTPYEGNPVGITGYPFDADAFADDTHIRVALNRPTWNFTNLLSYINILELKHDRQRLEASLLAGAA